MRSSTYSNLSQKCLNLCKLMLFLIILGSPVYGATDRVVLRESVLQVQRDELVMRLRAITGWSELSFDADRLLQLSNAGAVGGSISARNLLNRAVSGERFILFEDASSRKDVVFCRVVLGKFLRELPTEGEVYVVLIDFDDFRQVSGDKQAFAAFDVGWAVLHEIDHVVHESADPEHDTSAGDCEGHINNMRRELGLPLRNSYFFTFVPVNHEANFVSRFVRLGFDEVNPTSAKRKRYWLIWDAAIVGGLDRDSTEAGDHTTTNSVRAQSAFRSRAF